MSASELSEQVNPKIEQMQKQQQQPFFQYPYQQQRVSPSNSPSPNNQPGLDVQAALFLQQQNAVAGNPFARQPYGSSMAQLSLTAQAAQSNSSGVVNASSSSSFSGYPHLDGTSDAAASPSIPNTGSSLHGGYASAPSIYGSNYGNYADNISATDDSPHQIHSWSDNMQQHVFQPSHGMVQPPSLHYSMPTHRPNGYNNRNPQFDDVSQVDNQESFTPYGTQTHSGSNVGVWGYPQIPPPDYHHQTVSAGFVQGHHGARPIPRQHKSSHHQSTHYQPPFHPGTATPGPPIQTTDSNKGPEGSNLFIFHIPNHFTNYDMYQMFCPYGKLLSVRIMVEKETGRSRGFGFVSYDNPESAAQAIKERNGLIIGNKRLKVQHKQIKADNNPSTSTSQAPAPRQAYNDKEDHDSTLSSGYAVGIRDNNSVDSTSGTNAGTTMPWFDPTSKQFSEDALPPNPPTNEFPSLTEPPNGDLSLDNNCGVKRHQSTKQKHKSYTRSDNRTTDDESSALNRIGQLRNTLPDSASS